MTIFPAQQDFVSFARRRSVGLAVIVLLLVLSGVAGYALAEHFAMRALRAEARSPR